MSWLGGSLSSITGQISNLTKDILTEGTEETSDQGTELQIAKEKIQDCQNVITALNSENERLKRLNHDLEEKAESSELQINSISQQYRQLLEQKQEEIKKLKEDQHELLLHQSTPEYSQQKTEYGGYSSTNGAADDLDFSDSIGMQHEINNLRKENQRLQRQCDQLKALSKSGSTVDDQRQKEIEDLQRQLKEINHELATERENHQHEVASLQDIHSQKASVLRKKFKDEITQYKQKVSELEEKLADTSNTGESGSITQSPEYKQLEERVKALNHDNDQLKIEYDRVCQELKLSKNQLLDQLDSNHAQTLELLGDLREVRRHMGDNSVYRRDKLLEDKQYFIQQIIDSTLQQNELKSEIRDLEQEEDQLISEADTMVTSTGNKQVELDSLLKENTYLKKENLKLQEEIVKMEQNGGSPDQIDVIKADLEAEKEALEGVLVELRGQLKEKDQNLNNIVEQLEKQESEFKLLKQEKDDLEQTLNSSQSAVSQEDLSHLESEDSNLKGQLEQKTQLLEELSAEKSELETSLIELDAQHQEEINQVISIRNDLSGKLESLRSKVQELTELKDQLIEQNQTGKLRIEELIQNEKMYLEQIECQKIKLDELNAANENLSAEIKNIESSNDQYKDELKETKEKVLQLEESLKLSAEKNTKLDKEFQDKTLELDSVIENLTKDRDQLVQDVENKDKIILSLERKLEEKEENISSLEEQYNFMSEKLQQGSDSGEKDLLQRINDLQENLLEKDQDLNNLKSQCVGLQDELSNLQKEKAQIDKERETTNKKLEEMKEQYNKSAMTINDRHMDIQELKDKLNMTQAELNDKVSKIKEFREENSKFKDQINTLQIENESIRQTIDNNSSDGEKQTLSEDVVRLKSGLEELSNKCQKLTDIEQEYSDYKTDKEIYIDNLKEDISNLQNKIVKYEEEISKLQTVIADNKEEIDCFKEEMTIQKIEFSDKISSLKTENLTLETKFSNLQKTYDDKVQYYENMVKQLQSGNDVYTTSQVNENLLQQNAEKNETIKHLTEEINQLKRTISEAEKLTYSNSVDFIARESTISDMQNDLTSLAAENDVCQSKINEQKLIINELQCTKDNMREEIETLQAKVDELNKTVKKLNNIVLEQQDEIEDQKAGIIELNERCQSHVHSLQEKDNQMSKQEDILTVLRQVSIERDNEIQILNKRMKRAQGIISEDQRKFLDVDEVPNYSLPALEYHEKGSLEVGEKQEVREEMMKEQAVEQESEASRDVVSNMEHLQSLIKQKDDVINELQSNNASLLKMLENKSLSSNDQAVVDINRLENEIRNLKIEREQIMAVMNEKSREASSLKSEVHRLMNVVAAEKSAIDKLQKDMVQGSGPEDKDDMQREALQNLSRLVRDKDLEVEALKQKNETLLAVLQDSSSNGSELSTLMQDKDNLAKQLKVFQDERDQLVTFVNQKHEESVKYHQEVQRLTQYINTELEKHHRVQQEYDKLAPQFEDKKQALLKAQNELINYKQKYTELEVKYGEMVQKVNSSDTVDITTYNSQTDELKHSHEKIKELTESLRETEQKVSTLHQQNVEYEEDLAGRDTEIHSMKKQIDILTFQLQGAQGQLSDLKQEHSKSEQESSEHVSHMTMLKESNNRLTLEVQDRDFEIKSLKEKLHTLTSVVEGQRDEEGQVNNLLKENESLMSQIKELQQERNQTIMALKQRQIETQELQREGQKSRDKEVKYEKELERLRGHLIQMEEAYTRDAIESEEREKDLRNRLAIAEEKVLSSSSAIQTANQHALDQVDSLQQQLHQVAAQRDQAYLQLSALQDQVQQYAVSLSNLQLVLEQFQRDKDSQIATELEKYQKENTRLTKSVNQLQTELTSVKEKLSEAEDGLEAAARLHQQLDRCDQTISALKEEVQLREAALKNAEVEISDLRNSKDARVDKLVIKSMFLGYFTAPKNQQDSVLHTIGSVLNFSPEEFEKVLGSKSKGGWVSGWLGFGGAAATPPTTPTRRHTVSSTDKPDKSFSELFVKFLETESSPKQTMRLPAEEMAKDVQRHHKPAYNPFTAPRHVDDDKHLLMPSSSLSSTLPVFSPIVDSSQKQTSSAILNDVLKSSSAILNDVLKSS